MSASPPEDEVEEWFRDHTLGIEFLKKTTDAGPERRHRATSIMLHYAYADGETFEVTKENDDSGWGRFMRSIPEVKHWRDVFYSALAEELTPLDDDDDGRDTGSFTKRSVGTYIGVDNPRIQQWPELKLVLNGPNPYLSAEGDYVVTDERTRYTVEFKDTSWTWYDIGDLHPDKATKLPGIPVAIPDEVFAFLAWAWEADDFPMKIEWQMDETVTIDKQATRCGARCKDYETYGLCDRDTYDETCWQHA